MRKGLLPKKKLKDASEKPYMVREDKRLRRMLCGGQSWLRETVDEGGSCDECIY